MNLALDSPTSTALITTGGTVLVALIGLVPLLRRWNGAINEVRENAAEARSQVANTHSTNLRDDIDRMHDDVRAALAALERQGQDIAQLRRDAQELREELQTERTERMAVAQRLDHHLIRMHVV